MIPWFLIIWAIPSCLGYRLGPLLRYGVKPVFEDDPELYVTWTTPAYTRYYWQYTPGASYVGTLFAGQSEFPWIVEVRIDDADKFGVATGNLITSQAVLTSCRAIVFFNNYYKLRYGAQTSELELYERVRVAYCAIYLWEEFPRVLGTPPDAPTTEFPQKITPGQLLRPKGYFYPVQRGLDATGYSSGTRQITRMVPHPKCEIDDMVMDVGILVLRTHVYPVPPHIGFMPIFVDKNVIMSDVDLSNSTEQGRICYIASYGRDFANWHDHYVVDYKVKFRVYFAEFEVCFALWRYYECVEVSENECQEPSFSVNSSLKFDCWRPRAKVGAVCDQDRGAPLVCDGKVYGIVIRGLKFQYCNNLLPSGVLVLKTAFISEYYMNFLEGRYKVKRAYKAAYKASPSGVRSLLFDAGCRLYRIFVIGFVAAAVLRSSALL